MTKSKTPADSASAKPTFWYTESCFLPVSSHDRKGEGAFWGLFSKGTDPIHEGPTRMTQSLPKGPPPNTLTLGVRSQQ